MVVVTVVMPWVICCGRAVARVFPDRRRQIDAVVGFESEDREIAEARRDPRDGNVDVLLRPALDGLLNRQIESRAGRAEGYTDAIRCTVGPVRLLHHLRDERPARGLSTVPARLHGRAVCDRQAAAVPESCFLLTKGLQIVRIVR